MRQTQLSIVVCLAFAAAVTARVEPSSVNRTASLVSRLGSPVYRERESAFRELDELGEAGLADLKSATTSNDSETSRRAAELVRRIEQRLAAARILTPTLVDVELINLPVSEAVKKFSKDTRLPIQLVGDLKRISDRKVTYKSGKVPLWQAWTGFLNAAALTEWDGVTTGPNLPAPLTNQQNIVGQQVIGGQVFVRGNVVIRGRGRTSPAPAIRDMLVYDGTPSQLPVCFAGAVRVAVLPATTSLPNASADSDEIVMPLLVSVEPKIQWSTDKSPVVKLAQATDERGQRMTASIVGTAGVWEDEEMIFMRNFVGSQAVPSNQSGQRSQIVPVRLRRGEQPSKTFRELTGTLSLPIRATGELCACDAPLKQVGHIVRSGQGVSMAINGAERTTTSDIKLELSIEMPHDFSPPQMMGANQMPAIQGMQLQAQNGMIIQQSTANSLNLSGTNATEYMGVSLTDGKGQRYRVVALAHQTMTVGLDGLKLKVTLSFKPPTSDSEPVRLAFTGSYPLSVEVPFAFRDLPAP